MGVDEGEGGQWQRGWQLDTARFGGGAECTPWLVARVDQRHTSASWASLDDEKLTRRRDRAASLRSGLGPTSVPALVSERFRAFCLDAARPPGGWKLCPAPLAYPANFLFKNILIAMLNL